MDYGLLRGTAEGDSVVRDLLPTDFFLDPLDYEHRWLALNVAGAPTHRVGEGLFSYKTGALIGMVTDPNNTSHATGSAAILEALREVGITAKPRPAFAPSPIREPHSAPSGSCDDDFTHVGQLVRCSAREAGYKGALLPWILGPGCQIGKGVLRTYAGEVTYSVSSASQGLCQTWTTDGVNNQSKTLYVSISARISQEWAMIGRTMPGAASAVPEKEREIDWDDDLVVGPCTIVNEELRIYGRPSNRLKITATVYGSSCHGLKVSLDFYSGRHAYLGTVSAPCVMRTESMIAWEADGFVKPRLSNAAFVMRRATPE